MPQEHVFDEAARVADVLVQRRATAAIRAALRPGHGHTVQQAVAIERTIALEHMASGDVQIGLAAFRARMNPTFE